MTGNLTGVHVNTARRAQFQAETAEGAAPQIVILGGGFTGASLAWQLAQKSPHAGIHVIETRAHLGQGLAYSSADPSHRLNVPVRRMSIDPAQPHDFAAWLSSLEGQSTVNPDPDARTEKDEIFARRGDFGAYMQARMAPLLEQGRVRHLRARACDVSRDAHRRLMVHLEDGRRQSADILVVATGHPDPAAPKPLEGLIGSPALLAQPYDTARLAAIDPNAHVLILGAALGSADVVASLNRLGFRGQITCLSRHGLRSRGHQPASAPSQIVFDTPLPQSALDLLRRVRRAVAEAQTQGESWQAVFQKLRVQGQAIWTALPEPEQRRLLRHLRSFWDVHRYRLPPQTESLLRDLTAQGRLRYVAGHITAASPQQDKALVSWRPRGKSSPQTQQFDRVILTTGPAQDRCIAENPVLAGLARLGLIASDPMGLGLWTKDGHQALDSAGTASAGVFVAGPLARGHLGELVGAPECAEHMAKLAHKIADQLSTGLHNPMTRFSGVA